MRTVVTREIEADVTCAVEGMPWIEGVYALSLGDAARGDPDAFAIAIVLAPYSIEHLVQTHYAVVASTGTHETAGRILYVNPAMPAPAPMRHARRILLWPQERTDARARVANRKAEAERRGHADAAYVTMADLERAFRRLAEQATNDAAAVANDSAAPYRPVPAAAIAASLGGAIVLEIVADPFPPPRRKRVLVADDEPDTELALADLDDCDVVFVRDGWSAIDRLTTESFDVAICAVVLGDFTGAKIYRLVVAERPEMASRFAFLAGKDAIASAAPASMEGRVLARPLDVASVRALSRS